MSDNIKEVKKAFESAEDIAPDQSLDVPEDATEPPRTPADGPPPAPPVDDPHDPFMEMEGAKLPLNDTGNGRRFALYCGDDAIYVPRVGWHIWDGKRWKLDPDGIAVRRHGRPAAQHTTYHAPLGIRQRARTSAARAAQPRHAPGYPTTC